MSWIPAFASTIIVGSKNHRPAKFTWFRYQHPNVRKPEIQDLLSEDVDKAYIDNWAARPRRTAKWKEVTNA